MLLFSVISCSQAPIEKKPVRVKKTNSSKLDTIKFFFVGDAMGHHPMIAKAWDSEKKKYNYENWFQFFKPNLKKYDYCLLNLEVTLAGYPYEGYPRFSSPDDFAVALKNTGFNMFFTSNNHSFDRGVKGVNRTINVLDSINVDHTGTFINSAQRDSLYPYLKEIKGYKFAFLNYTYGTELPVKTPSVVNSIDTLQIKQDILKARKKGAQCIIAVIHWGEEYKNYENSFQREHAQWLANNYIDAVVGMHPHVVQPMKIFYSKNKKRVPVAFSLGNFVSRHARKQNIGIGIELSFVFDKEQFKWNNWGYTPIWTDELFSPKGHFPLYGTLMDDICNEKTKWSLNSNKKKLLNTFTDKTRNHLKEIPEIKW